MKVIVAGYPKTGTKTLAAALSLLGYSVYDYLEHYWYHYDDWTKILTDGGTVDDFKQMYQNVDATTDSPALFFWEEILDAFPDAKIILLTRDEESWMKSWKGQYAQNGNSIYRQFFLGFLSPSAWKLRKFDNLHEATVFGMVQQNRLSDIPVNEMMLRNRYRQHNTYVSTKAPTDKLLVFSVKEGWKPLCKFLGKSVPDRPFPHVNAGGQWFTELSTEKFILQRMHREATISACILLGLGIFGIFKFIGCGLPVTNFFKNS